MGEDDPASDRDDVVRLFPDYADSTLWFGPTHYPVDYADTHLTPELLSDLERWEQSYYDGLTDEPGRDLDWRSADLETAFEAEGRRLAQLVATELGSDFGVQLVTEREELFRSAAQATNPAAADAFRRFQRENDEWN